MPARGPPPTREPRASSSHSLCTDSNFKKAMASLLVRPQSAPALRARAQRVYRAGLQKCTYSGPTVVLQRRETQEEVVQRMHLERARQNDRHHRMRWSLLRAFFKACESHFMPKLTKRLVPLGYSRIKEEETRNATTAPLMDEISELFLLDVVDRRLLKAVGYNKGRTRRAISTVRATIRVGNLDLTHADVRRGRPHLATGAPLRLAPPCAPHVIKRDKFMLVIQRRGLNFPASMATQFWDMMARGDTLDFTRLLCSLRLLINTNPNPRAVGSGAGRAAESIETKLDGLFEIYERHCGKIDKLEQVFTIAAKSWEERKAIHDLLEKRFFPALTDIMHERDKFSGQLLTHDLLPSLTLTQEVFNEGLRRCPDLVNEFTAQLIHPAIQENRIKRVEGATLKTKHAETLCDDDLIIDASGVVRPKGACRNSLINWSNKKAAPL